MKVLENEAFYFQMKKANIYKASCAEISQYPAIHVEMKSYMTLTSKD